MFDRLPRSSLVPVSFQTWLSWRPFLPVSSTASRSRQRSSARRRRQQASSHQPFGFHTVGKIDECLN